ncbi:Phosphoacetylglucosamine mutase [Galdieria sulphuraria]|nr:Phosphoacetylglucosamine mutase [Galdieria sulphuraria]
MLDDNVVFEIQKWKPSQHFSYGTAGFRAHANLLPPVVFRCGILAAARALSIPCVCVGLMITASHNPSEDNGVKIIEPDGSMLSEKWETIASKLVNLDNPRQILEELCVEEDVALKNKSVRPTVYVGYDSRESSEPLSRLAQQAVKLMGLKYKCFGVQANKENYFQRIAMGWDTLSQYAFTNTLENENIFRIVDCANGVGSEAMQGLIEYTKIKNVLCVNTGDGELNKHCGADFIQKNVIFPIISDSSKIESIPSNALVHFCSLDGDADRLIYFIAEKSESDSWCSLTGQRVRVLEGDRLSVLAALVIKKFLDVLHGGNLSVGVIQTAYANGASTAFLKDLGEPIQVECVSTGVKHLERAARRYDIGIFWEANGHGTILFSESAKSFLREIIESTAKHTKKAALCLLALSSIANQATGDAISNFILAEALLKVMGWQDLTSWESLYQDLPNIYKALHVQNKEIIQTVDQERTVIAPESVSRVIKDLSESQPSYRFLIRPSGTENVVRIYGEGPSLQTLIHLMQQIENVVLQACGTPKA